MTPFVFLAAILLAAIGSQDSAGISPPIDAEERERIQVAVQQVFPGATSFTLRQAHVSPFGQRIVDHAVHVDLPVEEAEGRLGRHRSTRCERVRDTGDWSCSEDWQMLWEVRPAPNWTATCTGPIRGLLADEVSPDETVEIVDLFRTREGLRDFFRNTQTCDKRDIDPCRIMAVRKAGASGWETPGDYTATFNSGRYSYTVVHVDRDCPRTGDCTLEILGCTLVVID